MKIFNVMVHRVNITGNTILNPKAFLLAFISALTIHVSAQVSITNDGSLPDASAMLDMKSNDKGILIPRMTSDQRSAINSPATGLLVFDTDMGGFWFYDGSQWQDLSSGDDLGDHTATENINLNGNRLSNGTANTGLTIDDNGRVTMQTNFQDTTGLILESGHAPGLRFHQNVVQFWPDYSWEMTGDHTGFKLTDITGGTTRPWRIKAGSANDRVVIDGDYIGVGTDDPHATLDVNGQIRMRTGAVEGYIPLSDSNGVMTWTDPTSVTGDNLGDHKATSDIELANNWITNGTAGRGISVTDSGSVKLYNSSAGNVGLELLGGDSPTLRMSQDGSGWPAYTWDIAGNETSFFVRDVSGGSKLPLKIKSGSSNNRIVIDGQEVGIGTSDPNATLDVNGQICMRAGAADGYVAMSDSAGVMTWTALPAFGDNLGDHSASQNLALNGYWLSADGANQGIYLNSNGDVGLGNSSPDAKLHLKSTVVGDSTGMRISQGAFNSLFYHNDQGELVMRKWNQADQLILGASGDIGVGVSPTEKLDVSGKIRMRTGASDGYIPVSDANGVMTWTAPDAVADNLGNHTATQNIATNGNYISRDGDSEGIYITSDGHVGIGGWIYTPMFQVRADTIASVAGRFESKSTDVGVLWLSGKTGSQDVLWATSEDETDILVVKAGGQVGIGTNTPSYPLHVNGNAAKTTGSLWTSISDRRLKHDIHSYREGLAELLQLNPVYYKYNEKSGFDTGEQHIGLIAQEVQKAVPHMVEEFDMDGETYLNINPSAMIYMTVNAFKELNERDQVLQQQCNTQAEMISALESRVEELSQIVESMQPQVKTTTD